jgi:prephenate dehydrogenase
MPEPGPRVGIAGLGLIGASLALALRESAHAAAIHGWDRDAAIGERAACSGVIDRACADLAQLRRDVDVLVIAVPTLAAASLLRELLAAGEAGASLPIITDVASVKGPLRDVAAAADPALAARFVPGHPIAGSERSGLAAADATLFREHRVILTPLAATDAKALAVVTAMWEAAGAVVETLAVDEHDAVLAATSHLPHVLAFALVDALARSERSDDIFRFAAGGFRDFTRIASSDPVMWRDVTVANAPALLEVIDDFTRRLADLRGAVADGNAAALESTFRHAKAARDEFSQDLSGRMRRASETGG